MSDIEGDVLEAVKYLREVRPIDPGELVTYVPGASSAEEISTTVRAHAPELALIERKDGTFVPVEDAPLPWREPTIETFPSELEAVIDAVLRDAFGSSWATGTTGTQLRERIASLKAAYLAETTDTYDRQAGYAHLLYHFPRTYVAVRHCLAELMEREVLTNHLRVRDVGAGTGAALAALVDMVPRETLIEYEGIEPSPLRELLSKVGTRYAGPNVHLTIRDEPIEAIEDGGSFDLVMLANVLSELEDPQSVAQETFATVEESGSWIAIAPADPRTSIQLHDVARTLVPPGTVYSPTLWLWSDHQPSDDLWSFTEQPIPPPSVQRQLADEADAADREQYLTTDSRYSYAILRRDDTRRYEVRARSDTYRPLASIPETIGERLNVCVTKLSHDLGTGANALYRLGDGSQTVACFGALAQESSLNRPIATAPYGAVLSIERALVLWNDDEDAINLVIDDETIVDRIAP